MERIRIYSFSTILLLTFTGCRGAADVDVERVRSPYVDNRDLGPLMSQQPSMQSESFDSPPYQHSTDPSRSYSSSYRYQYGPCTNCHQQPAGLGGYSSSSYQSSYGNSGSMPSGSNYYNGGYGGTAYHRPVESSSTRHEVKEEEEYINGQQVYDLHHEKRFKDGQLVYNKKSENGPDNLGEDTSNAYNSYRRPISNYGLKDSSNSYAYHQQTEGRSEGKPVRFASPPHTSNANTQKQTYSSQSTTYGSANPQAPIKDEFYSDFHSEVERLREEMRKKTQNNHQNLYANQPIGGSGYPYSNQAVGGSSHRTEYSSQTKYINGKPIYSRNEERKYKDGKLIHNVTKENDVEKENIGFYYPDHSRPTYNNRNSQHRVESTETKSHTPVVTYPQSYFEQSYHGNQQYGHSSPSYSNSNYDSSSPMFSRPGYNRQNSYYENSYKNKDSYPTNTNSYYNTENRNYVSQQDLERNSPRRTSDHAPNAHKSEYSQSPYNSDSSSYSRVTQKSSNTQNRPNYSPASTYLVNKEFEKNVLKSSHEADDSTSDYLYSSSNRETHSPSYTAPSTHETSVTRESQSTSSVSRYGYPVNADGVDSDEPQNENEMPSYAAYNQQSPEERPNSIPANSPKSPDDDDVINEIHDDNERYDISPYDGEDQNLTPQTTTQQPLETGYPEYDSNRPSYNLNSQTVKSKEEHSITREKNIPNYPYRGEHSTYESESKYGHGSSRPSYENSRTYEETRRTSDRAVNQGGYVPSFDNRYPTRGGYSTYNSSRYEQEISNLLPSKWVETRTTWQYVNGVLVSETQFHKYYENGILIHENKTERTRDQMKAEGVDVLNLDLTPSELAAYGPPGVARTHSQKHEMHQMKRFKNGVPIYELNHERLFQDGDLVHEGRNEKHADDFPEYDSSNHQLLQSQRLNQQSVRHPGTIATTGYSSREGFSAIPKTYVRRHEIRQEQEYVDGQKIYDMHHEKEYKDGKLVKENKTELGPDELGVKNVPHRDALKDILAGKSPFQITDTSLNQQQQTAQNLLTTSCVTCNAETTGAGYVGHQSNIHTSLGSQSFSQPGNLGKEASYRKEFEVEEHYENGQLVKGKEEKKHWKDGSLVDHNSDVYFQGPSRVGHIPQGELESPLLGSKSSLRTSSNYGRNRNKCDSNPCRNGGTCRMSVAGEICICRFGFQGNRCEEAYCPSRYCRHRGTCSIVAGEHECQCPEGYKGERCATREITMSLAASGL